MSFFEEVKKTFLNKEEIFNLRYISSKYLFLFMSLVFFLDYYFIANKFFHLYLIETLPIVYIAFLFSFFLYSSFLVASFFSNISKSKLIIIFLSLFCITSIFSIPFIFPK